MSEVLYMKVTDDEYELPIAVAGSVSELARMLEMKPTTISHLLSVAKKNGWKSTYVRIEIEEG